MRSKRESREGAIRRADTLSAENSHLHEALRTFVLGYAGDAKREITHTEGADTIQVAFRLVGAKRAHGGTLVVIWDHGGNGAPDVSAHSFEAYKRDADERTALLGGAFQH